MNPRKHKPEPLNFTTKALAHFKLWDMYKDGVDLDKVEWVTH